MIFVYKCLVTCDLLGVTEHHCCKGDWQQDSASCCICLFYRLWLRPGSQPCLHCVGSCKLNPGEEGACMIHIRGGPFKFLYSKSAADCAHVILIERHVFSFAHLLTSTCRMSQKFNKVFYSQILFKSRILENWKVAFC